MAVKTWLPRKQTFEVKTPPNTPPLHAMVVLAGHRGCGKGVALVSILRHYKRHACADRVFWISPTMGSNKQYLDELGVLEGDRLESCDNAAMERVISEVTAESKEWTLYKKKLATWTKIHTAKDVKDIEPAILSMAESFDLLDEDAAKPKSKYGHRPVLHCVIDDCQGSALMCPGPKSKLVNTCIRHRHLGDGLGCSMWICVQSWSALGSLPRPCRENATGTCLWWSPHEQQREKMAEELADRRGPDVFMRAYEEATQGDHDFLFVDFYSKQARYRAGWNHIISPQKTDGARHADSQRAESLEGGAPARLPPPGQSSA
jgi:hypothetical protein